MKIYRDMRVPPSITILVSKQKFAVNLIAVLSTCALRDLGIVH